MAEDEGNEEAFIDHPQSLVQIAQKLAWPNFFRCKLARHTGQEEGATISHLLTRASVLLQKGLSLLLLSRIPGQCSVAKSPV